MYLLAFFCISFLEKYLFRSSDHLVSWVVCSLLLNVMSCLHILEIKPLSVTSSANIFSRFIGCHFLFCFFHGFLCSTQAFKFDKVPFIFAFNLKKMINNNRETVIIPPRSRNNTLPTTPKSPCMHAC